jgi:hypothetical protein
MVPLVLLSACTQSGDVDVEETAKSIEEVKPLTKIDRRIKEEQVRIAKYSEYARRDGDTLYLKLNSGMEKSFKNLTGCNETGECTYYEFKEHLADLNLYVLDIHFYEGGHYLVISGISGKSYLMYAYPKVSPDRVHLVAVSDNEGGGSENSIHLWRIEQSELIEEFSYNTEGLGYFNWNYFSEWQDNNTVIIKRLSINSSLTPCLKSDAFEAQFALRNENNIWKLDKEVIEGTVNCPPFQ